MVALSPASSPRAVERISRAKCCAAGRISFCSMLFLHWQIDGRIDRVFGMRLVIGEKLAKLDAGLSGFDHPASEHNLLWERGRCVARQRLGSLC